jgi:hypothetical protein
MNFLSAPTKLFFETHIMSRQEESANNAARMICWYFDCCVEGLRNDYYHADSCYELREVQQSPPPRQSGAKVVDISGLPTDIQTLCLQYHLGFLHFCEMAGVFRSHHKAAPEAVERACPGGKGLQAYAAYVWDVCWFWAEVHTLLDLVDPGHCPRCHLPPFSLKWLPKNLIWWILVYLQMTSISLVSFMPWPVTAAEWFASYVLLILVSFATMNYMMRKKLLVRQWQAYLMLAFTKYRAARHWRRVFGYSPRSLHPSTRLPPPAVLT